MKKGEIIFGVVLLIVASSTSISAAYINVSDGFSTAAFGSTQPVAITTNGTDFWILDFGDNFVYHLNKSGYNFSDGFSTSAFASTFLYGITNNGSDFWITQDLNDFCYHVNRTGGNISNGFSTSAIGSDSPIGITNNGSDFWITDSVDLFVYHVNKSGYNFSDGFSTSAIGSGSPRGITTNNSDFWIADNFDSFIYHVNRNGGNMSDGFSTLAFGSDNPQYITTNTLNGLPTNFWIVDLNDDFMYHLAFQDLIPPSIQIIYPPNDTNTSNIQINVNYTVRDNSALGSCWYSNSSGNINYTLASCANITGRTWLQGINNITIWANDSSNNVNSTSVSFFVDTIDPQISITYPTNNTNTTDANINVNYTLSDNRGIGSCWYSNDTYSVNTSLLKCINITTVIWNMGGHNVTVWVSDSAGNVNSSGITFNISSCSESWACTSWSTCSSSLQTRTCTDSNSCGTNESKPAESQACSGSGTTGTQGTGTISQQNQTQTFGIITSAQPVGFNITINNLDLTRITIATTQNVTGVSLIVSQANLPANLEIGLPTGASYQAFKVNVTKLNSSNIANITFIFKVEKSWLQQQNAPPGNIRLYRKPDNSSSWNSLQTTFTNSDSNYYYYSSVSSGFSTFLIFIDKTECVPGQKRCFSRNVQFCLGNSTWLVQSKCEYFCNNAECVTEISGINISIIFYGVIIAISSAIIIVAFFIFRRFARKKKGT